jgi:hypothetical protein
MSDNHNTPSQETQDHALETQAQIPTWVQEYIDQDPRLQKLSQEPTSKEAIVSVVSANTPILEKTDNLAEHPRVLWESLKEYSQMASNGDKFDEFLKKYGDKALDEAITKRDSKEWTSKDYREFVKYKKEITNTINNEKEDFLKNLNSKLPAISKEVDSITSNFSEKDKKLLSTSLSDARTGKWNNAAVEELKRQGVQDADIKSGKYDSYISASIIIENASKFDAARDPAFQKSIRELQSHGIPVRVQPDFASVTDHITERFASGNRTDTAIANIRTDLASKEYNWVHYDGIGERYTLIGADGRTRKDIYLDKPPRAEIRLSGLSIGREMPAVTPEDLQRQSIQDAYTKNYEKIGKLPIAPVSSNVAWENEKISTLYTQTLNTKLPIQERMTAIWDLKSLNQSRKEANFKSMLDGNTNPEPLGNKLEWELRTLDTLEWLYREEWSLLEQAKKIPSPAPDTFDNDAKKSLSYLSQIAYDELGQDTLTTVIDAINIRNKWKIAEINLSKNPKLDVAQEKELLMALAQLSRKSGIMTSWQWVDSTDAVIAARQMNSPNWRVSLQDMSKSLKFQTMKWANIESFTQYLYEKPETETTSEKPA